MLTWEQLVGLNYEAHEQGASGPNDAYLRRFENDSFLAFPVVPTLQGWGLFSLAPFSEVFENPQDAELRKLKVVAGSHRLFAERGAVVVTIEIRNARLRELPQIKPAPPRAFFNRMVHEGYMYLADEFDKINATDAAEKARKDGAEYA